MACSINYMPPHSNVRCQQSQLSISITIIETILAKVEHGKPIAISPELGNCAQGHLFSALAKLCGRREYRTGNELEEVLRGSMRLDNVVEQESLFFGLDTSRWRLGCCLV